MMRGQILPAFIAALLVEGVESTQIENAVTMVRGIPLGGSIAEDPLHRAFAFEQTTLLERVGSASKS